MNIKQKSALGFIIIVAAVLFFWFQNSNGEDPSESKPKSEDEDRYSVKAQVAYKQPLSKRFQANGSLMPNESMTLFSETAGRITQITFEEGSKVKKGQLLVKIDDAEPQAELKKVEEEQRLLEIREERNRKLLDKEGVSKDAYEGTLTELNTKKAEAELLKARIRKTAIYAPFDGKIGLRYVSPGAYVTANTAVAEFVDNQKLKLEFSVPEKYANLIKIDQEVTFETAAKPDTFRARIYAISPQIEQQSRNLQARALFDNREAQVFAGSFAQVGIEITSFDATLLVPSIAVVPELNKQYLFLVRNGKAKKQEVRIGSRTQSDIQIIDGLSEQDTVITEGILQISDGDQVEIISLKNEKNAS